jgi:putative MATE family efflux protein
LKFNTIQKWEDHAVSRELHLTSGSIAPQLVQLCLPVLAANVLQQLYNIINSLVVTHYIGDSAFAALGVAESVMNLFIYVITGACMGASVLIAQFYGEQNFPRLRQQLYVSAVLIGGCTLGAVFLGQLFLPQLLTVIQTPPELMADVSVYLRIILLGMVFTFTYNYLASTLRAVGDTKAALYFLLISLGYNLGAAWLFVAVLGLGITGTALATASAQLLSSALCAFYIRTRRPFLKIERDDMRMDRVLIHRTSSYAAVAALQQSSLYLGKLMVQSAVNGISLVSTAPISAFTAATRIENFIQAFGSSACESIAIFVAQNKGAGKERRALRGFALGGSMTVAGGIFFSILLHLGAAPLSAIFLDQSGQSTALCVSYLKLVSWFYFLSFGGNSFLGWYRGSGRMNITFCGTTIQISVRVIGTYLLVGIMSLDAVALSTGLGWVMITIFQSVVFLLERAGIWPKPSPLV